MQIEVVAGLGDAVLFCTRDRLIPGGVHGLQPVKHEVAPITAGERFVLGVSFHKSGRHLILLEFSPPGV